MDEKKFKEDMAFYSFGQHQDFLTYLFHLEATGWTIEDAREWVAGEKERMGQQSANAKKQHEEYIASLPKCPDCQAPMQILPVNTRPGDQTGDDSKSMLLCSNKECMNTIYNQQTVQDIMKELKR